MVAKLLWVCVGIIISISLLSLVVNTRPVCAVFILTDFIPVAIELSF